MASITGNKPRVTSLPPATPLAAEQGPTISAAEPEQKAEGTKGAESTAETKGAEGAEGAESHALGNVHKGIEVAHPIVEMVEHKLEHTAAHLAKEAKPKG